MAELPECDLVMKGGVTSGLVYQGAVLWLKDHYTFRSIGGTSAGAIAACLTAAAEYGRKDGVDGFARMREWTDKLGAEKGLLRSLFQPTRAARPAFEALVSVVTGSGSASARLLRGLGRILLEYWGLAAWAAVLVAAYVVTIERTDAASLGVLIASAVVLGVLAFLAVLASALGSAGWNLVRALEQNSFGMCPGVGQPGFGAPALGEWLHGAIQACAGRTSGEDPLTFADLETRGVSLRTITTDLAYARPVDLPVRDDFPIEYLFDPADLRQRVPAEIVEFLERISPPVTVKLRGGGERVLLTLPRRRMPIMLAARLSLSFPILLSTIRLWSVHPHDKQAIEHCFSDGGLSSNFPIHLFDAWVPSRPTFGLDLQTRQSESETNVHLAGSGKLDQPSPVRYTGVRGVVAFAKQAADAARNWHDATQAELPGFRDRVCQIRLSKDEGGLNLDMDENTIRVLMTRGTEAGQRITDLFRWDWHRFVRYLTVMQALQRSLRGSREGFDGFEPALSAGHLPSDTGYAIGHDGPWCRQAARATNWLIGTAERWGDGLPPPRGFDQGGGAEPEPTPAMRIVPDA
jgi:predicted acylesterase/phospholipase RssA